jgi:hypothetical protein
MDRIQGIARSRGVGAPRWLECARSDGFVFDQDGFLPLE